MFVHLIADLHLDKSSRDGNSCMFEVLEVQFLGLTQHPLLRVQNVHVLYSNILHMFLYFRHQPHRGSGEYVGPQNNLNLRAIEITFYEWT